MAVQFDRTPRLSMDVSREGYRVQGRLVHADYKETPLHHFFVRVTAILDNAFDAIRETYTDQEGRFSVLFPSLEEKVYITAQFTPWNTTKTVKAKEVTLDLSGKESTDVGTLSVDFYEYQPDFPLLKMPEKYSPEEEPFQYTVALIKGGGIYQAVAAVISLFPSNDLDKIQQLFGKNLTLEAEEHKKGITHSPEWIGDRLLNGFSPVHLLKSSKKRVVKVDINWNKYEFDNEYQLPNVKAYFKVGEKTLIAERIYLQFRKLVAGAKTLPPVTKKEELTDWKKYSAGNPDFSQAIRSFITAYLAEGEISEHLGAGHLNVEQYAVAAFRHLRNNPLKKLLFPHLRSAILINHQGAKVIFGEKGALTVTTALTAKGVADKLRDKLASMDYSDYCPRKPVGSQHSFSHIANLYWSQLSQWVSQFIHDHKEEIKKEWIEVRRMSDDLVTHSIPYEPLDGKKSSKWVDLHEIDNSKRERVSINGVLKSIRPITVTNQPEEKDWERLSQMCTYAIYHATFWHSWVHNKQTEDAGDWRYGVLGLRGTGIGSVNDPSLQPKGEDLATQLKLAFLLPAVKYGYVTRNEYGDIHPEFIERVKKLKPEFEKYGINIDEFLRSCVNI